MQGRLAAGQGNAKGAKLLKFCEPFLQNLKRHGIACLVELRTVTTGQVAAPEHDHLGKKWAVSETGKKVWRHDRVCAQEPPRVTRTRRLDKKGRGLPSRRRLFRKQRCATHVS